VPFAKKPALEIKTMKAILTLPFALALAACGSQGTSSSVQSASVAVPPDLYVCTTDSDLNLTYNTTSVIGRGELLISRATSTEASITLLDARGDDINITALAGGAKLVSASSYIADLETTTWEFKLPEIELSGIGASATFKTVLKETVDPTTIMGPMPNQHQVVTKHDATCTASFVEFVTR
jgi:hypothetical protein